MKRKTQTIDIEVKRWFDRTYGNTYFSAQITLDYGLPSVRTYTLPYQYGYGNHAEYVARDLLIEKGELIGREFDLHALSRLCADQKIILRVNYKDTTKREVKEFGL